MFCHNMVILFGTLGAQYYFFSCCWIKTSMFTLSKFKSRVRIYHLFRHHGSWGLCKGVSISGRTDNYQDYLMSLLIEIEITLEWENLRKITRGIKKQTLGRRKRKYDFYFDFLGKIQLIFFCKQQQKYKFYETRSLGPFQLLRRAGGLIRPSQPFGSFWGSSVTSSIAEGANQACSIQCQK